MTKIKALGISSGGLDSILSAFVLMDAGIDVKWVTFETPFFSADKSKHASSLYNIPMRVETITKDYVNMLKNPKGGYGKNMNPCMDCHSFMFRKAGDLMEEEGASFLFSGEVAGQRPMSQTKNALRYVEKNSGYQGYIVRPLSGKILPETMPEQKGWLQREDLLDIFGRSRKRQMELAEKYGITDYPSPGGGCLLTDKIFSRRLKDLFEYQKILDILDYELLNYGRHIRISPEEKLIVGRNQNENEKLREIASRLDCIKIRIQDYPGPFSILRGSGENMFVAGSICAGYSKAVSEGSCVVLFESKGKELAKFVHVIDKADVVDMMI